MLSNSLQAKTWSRSGIEFSTPSTLYEKNEVLFLKTSSEIADHLSSVLDKHVPQSIKPSLRLDKIRIVFDRTDATDALFMSPGHYTGFREEELHSESVIVINPAIIQNRNILRLVTHEFFHFLHYDLNPKELDWMKEGMAQYFEYLVHGNINYNNVEMALKNSRFPLETDFDLMQVNPEKYGNSFLFIYHLLSQCGTQNDLWRVAAAKDHVARDTITNFLSVKKNEKALCASVTSIMSSFTLAKMINEPTGKMDETTVAWGVDSTMPSSEQIAESLNGLETKTLKKFFEKLPSFFGLKFPLARATFLNESAFLSMKLESVHLYYLSGNYPMKLQKINTLLELKTKTTGDLVIFKVR